MSARVTPVGGVLERYRDLLPITDDTPALTLGEGSTPLVAAPSVAEWVGVEAVYCKFEGMNPTGSFKDRGMVVAVAKAKEAGARTLICASTGNTAASAAAYAARAGLQAVIVVPAGGAAPAKLRQARVHGARALEVEGSFESVLDLVRAVADDAGVALVNSVNPYRILGQATAAYEVCDALCSAPDVLALPVGNGGNITAYWRGFTTYLAEARADKTPRMLGVQAQGADPLVQGHPIAEARTLASAIRIGRPATWEPALDAAFASGGWIRSVPDQEILAAQGELARREGIFCEPASAASLAGLRRAVAEGAVPPAARCAVVLTGHGLKDPEVADSSGERPERITADVDALRRFLSSAP